MSQMLKSSGSMAAATLTSRLLGMVREMVYYSFMGQRCFSICVHDPEPVPAVAG